MSNIQRSQEFINSKKLINVINNYKDFKKDNYFDEEKLLATIYEKQKRNKGLFKPMYVKPKIEGSRWYCKTGYAAMSRQVRNYLADGIYVDVDMSNCIYNVFLSIAKNNGIKHEAIEFYVNNRSEILEKIMTDQDKTRDEAKEIFTKICFSAVFDKKIEEHEDFYDLKKQIRKVQKWLINNTDITDIKKLYKSDDYNYYGKIISQIYFKIEWDILSKAIKYLKDSDYDVCADLHDGFFVRIDEDMDEEDFVKKLDLFLPELNEFILEKTKIKVSFIVKPMTDKIDLDDEMDIMGEMEHRYNELKAEFEQSVGKIESAVKFVIDDKIDNTYKLLTKNDLLIRYEDFYSQDKFFFFSSKGLSFIKTWLLDPNKRTYRKMDFIPDVNKCPDDVYNIFKGFDIANYTENFTGEITESDEKGLQTILDHIKFLCDDGGEEVHNMFEYVLDWIAHLFQKPTEKATTCLILKGYEGCGKGILFHLLRKMLGLVYGFTTAHPMSEIFGNFNSSSSNKMLINIDEIDKKQALSIYESLKKYITEDTIEYKQKFMDNCEIKNLSRMLITTNNDQTIAISESNRRFVLIECIHKKKPTIDTIDTLLYNKNAHMLFYKFLMDRDIKNVNLEKFPISNLYKKALENSARPILDFLDSISDTQFSTFKGLKSTTISSFYEMYKSWCHETSNFVQKRKDFKCDLFNGNQVFKEVRTKTNRLICWEQDDFNEYLKSNGFTPPPMFEPDTDDDEAFYSNNTTDLDI
jgi:hypothetical protein